jgi:hypothetical protein
VVQRRMPGIYVLLRTKADQEHHLPPLHLDQENLRQLAVQSYDLVSHLIIPDLPSGSSTPLRDLNNHIVAHLLHPNHQSLQRVLGPFHQHYPTLELLPPAQLLRRSKINHHLRHDQYGLVLAEHLINWQRRLQMMEVQVR